jgi:hypothetical protein
LKGCWVAGYGHTVCRYVDRQIQRVLIIDY